MRAPSLHDVSRGAFWFVCVPSRGHAQGTVAKVAVARLGLPVGAVGRRQLGRQVLRLAHRVRRDVVRGLCHRET